MRVLVTGSHGFIGSQLVLALKERGDEVLECDFDRMDEDHGPNYYEDLFSPIPRKGRMNHLDEIYHLACVNQEAALYDSAKNLRVNALGAQHMAKHAATSGARFVYTSTASVYGNQICYPIPNSEEVYPKTDYAVAKLAGEHFVKNSGADFTVFRLSNVYGPGQTTDNPYCGVVAKFFEAAMAGEPLKIIGDGSQTRDFTYVEDILPHLMNPELKGVLNCSHGKETCISDLAFQVLPLINEFTAQNMVKFVPERPVDGIQRRCLISDVTCPTDLQTGLKQTYDWILAQNAHFPHNSVGEAELQV
jgi:UDP-glucose 4-epimerase